MTRTEIKKELRYATFELGMLAGKMTVPVMLESTT